MQDYSTNWVHDNQKYAFRPCKPPNRKRRRSGSPNSDILADIPHHMLNVFSARPFDATSDGECYDWISKGPQAMFAHTFPVFLQPRGLELSSNHIDNSGSSFHVFKYSPLCSGNFEDRQDLETDGLYDDNYDNYDIPQLNVNEARHLPYQTPSQRFSEYQYFPPWFPESIDSTSSICSIPLTLSSMSHDVSFCESPYNIPGPSDPLFANVSPFLYRPEEHLLYSGRDLDIEFSQSSVVSDGLSFTGVRDTSNVHLDKGVGLGLSNISRSPVDLYDTPYNFGNADEQRFSQDEKIFNSPLMPKPQAYSFPCAKTL